MLSTGGGPNTLIALNDLEERLAVLAGLYAAVEGLQGTSSFGAPSSQETTNQMPTAPQSRQYALGTAYFDDDDCDEEGDDFENSVNNGGNGTQDQAQDDFALAEGGNDENVEDFDRTQNSGSSRLPPTPKRQKKTDSFALLQHQIKNQEAYYEAVQSGISSFERHVKDGVYYQKQTYKKLASIENLKQQELEEQKRHNRAMEKIALEKLKVKQQILQMEANFISEQ